MTVRFFGWGCKIDAELKRVLDQDARLSPPWFDLDSGTCRQLRKPLEFRSGCQHMDRDSCFCWAVGKGDIFFQKPGWNSVLNHAFDGRSRLLSWCDWCKEGDLRETESLMGASAIAASVKKHFIIELKAPDREPACLKKIGPCVIILAGKYQPRQTVLESIFSCLHFPGLFSPQQFLWVIKVNRLIQINV